MALTLDLKPEVQRALAQQAAARGRALEAYAASLLERAAGFDAGPEAPVGGRHPGRKSLAQLFAESPFRGLGMDFERSPDLGRDIEL